MGVAKLYEPKLVEYLKQKRRQRELSDLAARRGGLRAPLPPPLRRGSKDPSAVGAKDRVRDTTVTDA